MPCAVYLEIFCTPAMEVLNAVNLVGGVHGEGNPVQALLADHAREAGGVVRLSSGPEKKFLVKHFFGGVQTSRCGRGWAWSTCSTSPRCSCSTSGTMACCRSPRRRAGQGGDCKEIPNTECKIPNANI